MDFSTVDLNTFDNCRTISNLRQLVDESDGEKKINRQRSLEASILVADAWQLLVRARQRATAEAIDETGHGVFFSAWNAIAVEVFMKTTPSRKEATKDGQDSDGEECKDDRGSSERDSEEAIERAISRVAQAWNLIESLKGKDVTDAEAIREIGIRCFGDWRFRAAMVAARVESLARAETHVKEVEPMDCAASAT